MTSDITLTTDADQTPIAPGNRVSDVTATAAAPRISSAARRSSISSRSSRRDYEVATREHNGIKLSVYYHPGHDWNVPKMLNAMGAALDYYRANFGPYQFNYARIIEFPGYASFAQAFAGTMPYSESIGFNADTNDPTKIDFTTYVVAHEMAHQYWAHQVIGADMQGGTMTSETLAQYSALMVMKHLYGPDKIRRFLKYELDNYLRLGRPKWSRKCRSSGSRTRPTSTTARARSPCTCCRSGWARLRSIAHCRGSSRGSASRARRTSGRST